MVRHFVSGFGLNLAFAISAFTFSIAASATQSFAIQNGQIIDPNGKIFIARGINVYDSQMAQVCADAACNPLMSLFPGLNIVRLNVYKYNSPAYYQTFVSRLSALGVVVEIENHAGPTGSGGDSGAYTGSALVSETNWYASLAKAFANNPYVWFGTLNEPSGDIAAIVAEQVATYQAIRGAGSSAILMVEEIVQYDTGSPAPYTGSPSAYSSMKNIVWDPHYYGWLVNYSTNLAMIQSSIATVLTGNQKNMSADGKVPVIIGEYGNSTSGASLDANGMQVVEAVEASGLGSIAWGYDPDPIGDELTSNGKLTAPFGTTVAAFIAKGLSADPLPAPPAVQDPPPPPVSIAPTPLVPKPCATSPSRTVVTNAGGTICDSAHHVWKINSDGSLSMDGVVAKYSGNVVKLAFVDGVLWQENSKRLWWEYSSSSWLPAAGTSKSPLARFAKPRLLRR